MTVDIVSSNTARRRNGPSRCILDFLNSYRPAITETFLDFGCGFGEDTDYLRSLGYECDRYDPHFFPEYPTKKYDYVTCFYVLNVIPGFDRRIDTICSVLDLTKKKAIFTVRNTAYTNPKWCIPHNDGYYDTMHKMFNKVFNKSELRFLFSFIGNYPPEYFRGYYRVIIDNYGG